MHHSVYALLTENPFISKYLLIAAKLLATCGRIFRACVRVLLHAVVKIPSSVEEHSTAQLPHSTPHAHQQYSQSDTSSSELHQEAAEHDPESVPQGAPPSASAPTIHSLAAPHSCHGEEGERDQELVQLEMQLEAWCGDMKRNILVGSAAL